MRAGMQIGRSWRPLARILLLWLAGVASPVAWPVAQAQFFGFREAEQDIVAMYLFNGQDEAGFKRNLEVSTTLRVDRVAKVTRLSEDQRAKLELALRGDLNRFYREMEAIRAQAKELNIQDQNDMQRAWQLISPLYQRFQSGGVIGKDSLFENVLASVLDDEQQQAYQQYLDQRSLFKMQALAEVSIAEMEKQMPLRADQREQLIKLVLEQKMPRETQRGMEMYVGFSIMRRIERETVGQILDANQMKVYDDLIKRFGRIGGIQW